MDQHHGRRCSTASTRPLARILTQSCAQPWTRLIGCIGCIRCIAFLFRLHSSPVWSCVDQKSRAWQEPVDRARGGIVHPIAKHEPRHFVLRLSLLLRVIRLQRFSLLLRTLTNHHGGANIKSRHFADGAGLLPTMHYDTNSYLLYKRKSLSRSGYAVLKMTENRIDTRDCRRWRQCVGSPIWSFRICPPSQDRRNAIHPIISKPLLTSPPCFVAAFFFSSCAKLVLFVLPTPRGTSLLTLKGYLKMPLDCPGFPRSLHRRPAGYLH